MATALRSHLARAVITLACLPAASGCGTVSQAPARPDAPPDFVLYNARVFTADPARPWAEAVAIRGERVLAVGTDEDVRPLAGPGTRVVDLVGRVVIPGVNDVHTHLGYHAPIGPSVPVPFENWALGPEPQPVLDSLAALARRTPPGTWLRGAMGLAIRNSPVRRADLDRVAPDHPVILVATVGHGSMVNTRALRAMGVTDMAADPAGGWYERDPATGALTGLLDGSAQYAAWGAYFSTLPDDGVVAYLREAAQQALRFGVTTLQHMPSFVGAAETERWFGEAALPVRVRLHQWPFPGRRAEWAALRGRRPSTLSYVSGVKYVVDGTPIEQWALMRRPYEGRPGWYGRPYYSAEEVRGMLREALTGEDQLMLHVVGDSATAVVLRAMESLAPDSVWRPLRVRIEHGAGVTGPDVERARRLGVVLTQWRASAAQVAAWHRAGVPLAYGSDGEPGNPWWELSWQTTPQDGGAALSREEALRAYTRGSAYAEFAEHEKGTLAPGMLADLAVLSQDVFAVPTEALPGTTSVLTLVGGRVAYDAGVLGLSGGGGP